jgi:hypothetical protein
MLSTPKLVYLRNENNLFALTVFYLTQSTLFFAYFTESSLICGALKMVGKMLGFALYCIATHNLEQRTIYFLLRKGIFYLVMFFR